MTDNLKIPSDKQGGFDDIKNSFKGKKQIEKIFLI